MSGSNNPYLANPWANPLVDPRALNLTPPDPTLQQAPGLPGATPQLQFIAAQQPKKGSWQYGIRPDPDGTYSLHASPPDSDQWHGPLMGSDSLDLGAALRRLDLWRRQTPSGS